MPSVVTFIDLKQQNHTLGLFCVECNRWGEADISSLISSGRGEYSLTDAKFRCRDCGELAEKQLRPPVPVIGGAVAYIRS